MNTADNGQNSLPETSFVLDMDQLSRGDILLTASPGQPVSIAIRTLTNSRYSHAILVLEPPYAIEAADFGVVKFRLDRFAISAPENIAVRRLKEHHRSSFNMDAAVAFAQSMVDREYSNADVYTSLFKWIPQSESGTFFCSQLVASAYERGGVNLTGRIAAKVSPAAIADSFMLSEHPLALKRIRTGQLPFVPMFIDAPHAATPAEMESSGRQKAVDPARPVFAHYGIEVHDFNGALLSVERAYASNQPFCNELDMALAMAMRESGLLASVCELTPPDLDAFFIDFYVAHGLNDGSLSPQAQDGLLAFYGKELDRLRRTNEERDKDVAAFKKIYLQTGLECFRLHLARTLQVSLASTRMHDAMERATTLLKQSNRS